MVVLATFDRFLIISSFRNARRLIVCSSMIIIIIFGDLFYCGDIVSNGVITSCSASTSKQCGFYNQIARLLTVLFIPEIVILMFTISIIHNLRFFQVTASQQYRIRKTDRQIMKVNLKIILQTFYKQPRPVSTLLKGLIRWLVHIHYNPKAITKTECSTLILNKKEPVVAAYLICSHAS